MTLVVPPGTYPPGVATAAQLRHAIGVGDLPTIRKISVSPKITSLYTPGLVAVAVKSGHMGILEWAVYRFVLAHRVPRYLLAGLLTASQGAPSLFAKGVAPAANETSFGGAFDFAAWCVRRTDAAAPPAKRALGSRTAAEVAAGAPDWPAEIAAAWAAADSLAWRNWSHSVRVHAWLEALFGGDTRFGAAPGHAA